MNTFFTQLCCQHTRVNYMQARLSACNRNYFTMTHQFELWHCLQVAMREDYWLTKQTFQNHTKTPTHTHTHTIYTLCWPHSHTYTQMTTHPKYGENATDVEVHAQGLGQFGFWCRGEVEWSTWCLLYAMHINFHEILYQ